MEYVYPAIFHKNSDNSYTVLFPDLPGCISEGKTLENAFKMAQSALAQWIDYLAEKKQAIPQASVLADIQTSSNEEFVNFVYAAVTDNRTAKKIQALAES